MNLKKTLVFLAILFVLSPFCHANPIFKDNLSSFEPIGFSKKGGFAYLEKQGQVAFQANPKGQKKIPYLGKIGL